MANDKQTIGEALLASNQQVANALGMIGKLLRESGDDAAKKVHAFYRESRRIVEAFDVGAGLQVRPEILTLAATLGTSTSTSTSDQKMPETEDFVLLEISGHLLVTDWATEYGLDGPRSRMLVKANNCKVNFKLKDQASRVFTAKNDFPLSRILVEAGGQPMSFAREGAPMFVIPHGTIPMFTGTLQSTSAEVVGADANYGFALYGCYLSRPR